MSKLENNHFRRAANPRRKDTMMKVTENRTLSASDLRSACIENDWYTLGTNEEYSNLMERIEYGKDVTTEKLFELASDICDHSEIYGYEDRHEAIAGIMFGIARKCQSTFEIEE